MISKAVIFLGMPGSGKGTQAKLLETKIQGFKHISTGEMLRNEIAKGTSFGNKIKFLMDSGDLVDDSLIEELLHKVVSNDENYIFDGFPRNLNQLNFLDNFFVLKKICLKRVFYFEITQEDVVTRILGRRVCNICKKEFNVVLHKLMNNFCPNCHKDSLFIRKDDNEITVKNRLNVYLKETLPILDIYDSRGILTKINAVNEIDYIFNEILKFI